VTSGGVWGEPAWSPDGRRLAVTLVSASSTRVVTLAADGSGVPELVADDRSLNSATHWLDEWSPAAS